MSALQPGSVAVIGSVNFDTVITTEHFAGAGETILGTGVAQHLGGKGANQAVAAARAGGVQTTFVGSVGDDAAGSAVLAQLQEPRLHVQLTRDPDAPTGQAFVTVDASGRTRSSSSRSERTPLTHRSRWRCSRRSVVLLQLEIDEDTVRHALRAASPNTTRILNAAPMQSWAGAVLDDVDILVVNEGEAQALANTSDRSEALEQLAAQVPVVVMTLGGDGALVAAGIDRVTIPAFAAHVLDTTAAGDTFCGVLAAELAQHGIDELTRAVTRASAAASLAVESAGATTSIPTVDAVADRANPLRRATAHDSCPAPKLSRHRKTACTQPSHPVRDRRGVVLIGILVADLLLARRRPHLPTPCESALWVSFYVALALLFALTLGIVNGPNTATQFFAGWLTEYSLSIDNLFVFLLLMTRFAVPAHLQQQTLMIGIILALIFRAAFIILGAALIEQFSWIFYIFGAFLIYTAIKQVFDSDDDEPNDNAITRTLKRRLSLTDTFAGTRLSVRIDGRRRFTRCSS